MFTLKDQTESVLRSWLGPSLHPFSSRPGPNITLPRYTLAHTLGERSRFDRETRVLRAHNRLGSVSASPPTTLTTLNPKRISETGVTSLSVAAQTLGEEYTDIWQSTSNGTGVSQRRRLALILLPVLPVYVAARLNLWYPPGDSTLGKVRQSLPATLGIAGETNLALFYLRGVYYDLVKRVLGIRYVRGLRASPFICRGWLKRVPRFDFSIHRCRKIQTVDRRRTLSWEYCLPRDWLIDLSHGFVL